MTELFVRLFSTLSRDNIFKPFFKFEDNGADTMCSNDCSPSDSSGNYVLPTCDPLTTLDDCDTVTPHATLKCSNTNLPSEETLNNCASPHPADVGGVRTGFPNFDPAEYKTYMRVFTKLVPLTTNPIGVPFMNQFGTVWNRATELRLVFVNFPFLTQASRDESFIVRLRPTPSGLRSRSMSRYLKTV